MGASSFGLCLGGTTASVAPDAELSPGQLASKTEQAQASTATRTSFIDIDSSLSRVQGMAARDL